MNSAANRHRLLKLRAEDEDDLTVMSSQLQDALVPIADMAFLGEKQLFIMVVNRFMWERVAEPTPQSGEPIFLRTNCGVRFCGVRGVRYRGLDRSDRRQVLNLLAIEAADSGVLLRFAGGGDVRLDCDKVDCRMQDIDEPWPTRHRPAHASDDAAESRQSSHPEQS